MDKNGKGPYMVRQYWERGDHDAKKNTPGWMRDKKLYKGMKDIVDHMVYIFGFESIESLQKWFSKSELKKMKELGYNIYQIKVPKVIYGDAQCVFKRSEVKKSVLFNQTKKAA